MAPVSAAENFEAQKALLHQILVRTPESRGALPPLEEEFSVWREWFQKLGEWLDKYLHGFSFNLGMGDWSLGKSIFYIILFTLIVGIIYLLLRNRPSFGARISKPQELQGSKPNLDHLLVQLENALKINDLSLAGRIRWKLFLFRTHKSHNATPLEVFGQDSRDFFSPYYRLMFGKHGERKLYQSFDEHLQGREGGGG